jgi:DNA-binding protein H-NS
MPTLDQIQAKVKKLQAQADALIAKQSSAVLANISALMDKHGLTAADIEAHVGGAKTRGRKPGASAANLKTRTTVKAKGGLPPKYRDPKSGATWSGHARPPQWIKNAKDRSKFLITGASAPLASKGKAKSKAAAKPVSKAVTKSKLPPKYINRKTGETWSGHARPPQWIAGVKDRSKFLIAGAADGGAVGNGAAASKAKPARKSGVVAKKAAAKKVVAKKATAKKAVAKKAPAVKKFASKKVVGKKVVPTVKKVASKKVLPKRAVVAR